jgi:hypothetical protein
MKLHSIECKTVNFGGVPCLPFARLTGPSWLFFWNRPPGSHTWWGVDFIIPVPFCIARGDNVTIEIFLVACLNLAPLVALLPPNCGLVCRPTHPASYFTRIESILSGPNYISTTLYPMLSSFVSCLLVAVLSISQSFCDLCRPISDPSKPVLKSLMLQVVDLKAVFVTFVVTNLRMCLNANRSHDLVMWPVSLPTLGPTFHRVCRGLRGLLNTSQSHPHRAY